MVQGTIKSENTTIMQGCICNLIFFLTSLPSRDTLRSKHNNRMIHFIRRFQKEKSVQSTIISEENNNYEGVYYITIKYIQLDVLLHVPHCPDTLRSENNNRLIHFIRRYQKEHSVQGTIKSE